MVLVCHRTTDKCTWEQCVKPISLPAYSCTKEEIVMNPWDCMDLQEHQIKNICDRWIDSKFDIWGSAPTPPPACAVSDEWTITATPTTVSEISNVYLFDVDTSGWDVDLTWISITWLTDWATLRFKKSTNDAWKILFTEWWKTYNFANRVWEYYCIVYNKCDDSYHIV